MTKKDAVEVNEETATLKEIPIRSTFPATLRYEGRASGKPYVWQKSGDVVLVDTEDVPTLLAKRLGNGGCCGGSAEGNRLFELA